MSAKHTDSSGSFNNASTQNFNSTPTNPSWVTNGVQGLAGTVSNLSAQDPYSFVAGANPLQTQAAAGASSLSGTPWAYDGASDVTRGIANQSAPDIASLMAQFQNPYTNQVVNTSLADFDQNAGRTQAQDQLARAGDTTFGGSGGAIQTSLSNDALARSRASLDAGLRNQGYQTALGGATSQAGVDQQNTAQRLAAANQLSTIANDYGANSRANIATQAGLGGQLQQIDQAQAQAPVSAAGSLSSILASLPLSLFQGQTGTTTGTQSGSSKGSTTQIGGSVGWNAKNGFSVGGG
jgi:hypothetical protein